ncbi:C6 zinc finger domain protein [Colletotrichum karsti]|uniref:C6 zinc finger domain protein n=1 Tax=Colletotrichum karsti TaxID=1095194 RepID=A0A9P6LKG5_9PEZI|nr:C6 zinc finger domain protein [Colletotrichum karsti]KAF9876733.1 C6 zinc finger domain protein [Colletotrichum karsti]
MTKATRMSTPGLRQACDTCHFKKIRCLRVPEAGNDGPCKRCSREGIACVFSPASKTGRPKKASAAGINSRPISSWTPRQPPGESTESPSYWLNPPWDDIDGGTVSVPSSLCFDESFPELNNTDQPEVMVLKRFEQLSAFQGQLVTKRREHYPIFQRRGIDASHGIQDLLDITQKVTKFSTWLMMGGAKFAYRTPMLSSMSDETALMMVMSPATLVLDTFVDVLEMAFPSLKSKDPGPVSSAVATAPASASAVSDDGLFAIDPELLLLNQAPAAAVLPNVEIVRDLANPVCIYILLTSFQEQVDAMRRAFDMALGAFPRMNSAAGAKGLLPVMMDEYLEKIKFVQGHITRASGDNLMIGMD